MRDVAEEVRVILDNQAGVLTALLKTNWAQVEPQQIHMRMRFLFQKNREAKQLLENGQALVEETPGAVQEEKAGEPAEPDPEEEEGDEEEAEEPSEDDEGLADDVARDFLFDRE